MKKHLRYMSKDGETPIHAVIHYSSDESGRSAPRAILQISHGMTEFIERYDRFAEFMVDHGFVVVGHDHLGHGRSVRDRGDYGYFAQDPDQTLVRDMHQLRINVSKRYPDLPYFMMGHSMGSFLLREYLAQYSEGLAGAIIMGTGYTNPAIVLLGIEATKMLAAFWGWHHRSLLIQALTYGPSYRGYSFSGKDIERNWLTKDLNVVKEFQDSPFTGFLFTLNGHRGLFQAVRASCLKKNAKQISKDLPLFLISGGDDPVGGLGKGVKKVYDLYNKVGIKNVTMNLYPGDRHEILSELDHEQVEEDILLWIEEKLDV